MTFTLEGLNCPVCAGKIEESVGKIPDLKDVKVNFPTGTMKFTSSAAKKREQLAEEIQQIVNSIETGVTVVSEQGKKDAPADRKKRPIEIISSLPVRLAMGAILFTAGFIPAVPWKPVFLLAGYLIIGFDVLLNAGKNILKGRVLDEFFLMSAATVGAVVLGEYPEALGVMLFYQAGEYLQQRAVNKSKKSVSALLAVKPDTARILTEDGEARITDPENVASGSRILVHAGERIPLDGVIEKGSGEIDGKAITGESIPVSVKPGDSVQSGSICMNTALTIKTTGEFSESTVNRILELVQSAAEKKSGTERFITRFARIYTPVVVSLAVLLALVPPLFIEGATFSEWIYRGLTFLVISCPCALVLSIPLGYFAGIGAASKAGIIFKGGTVIDRLSGVRQVVFDKTGTLTDGNHTLVSIAVREEGSEKEMLETAAALEQHSTHPLGRVLARHSEKSGPIEEFDEYREIPGSGVSALRRGRRYSIGSSVFLENAGVEIPEKEKESGSTAVHMAIDGSWAATFFMGDSIRQEAADVIKELKRLGIEKTGLFSGDSEAAVKRVGESLGIDDIRWQMLPHQKLEALEKAEPGPSAYIGDGINDAPSIARADIGIAMGGVGSDAAVEAADVILVRDRLEGLADAVKISRFTRRVVYQNIVLVFAVKAALLTLGALGISSMWMAVFGDVGVALLAVLNSSRILGFVGR